MSTTPLEIWDDGDPIYLAGSIEQIEVKQTKRPSRGGFTEYATFHVRNTGGVTRCIVWPEDYWKYVTDLSQPTACLYGRVDKRGKTAEFVVLKFVTPHELANVANTVRR